MLSLPIHLLSQLSIQIFILTWLIFATVMFMQTTWKKNQPYTPGWLVGNCHSSAWLNKPIVSPCHWGEYKTLTLGSKIKRGINNSCLHRKPYRCPKWNSVPWSKIKAYRWRPGTCYNVEELWRCAQRKKPDTREQMLYEVTNDVTVNDILRWSKLLWRQNTEQRKRWEN